MNRIKFVKAGQSVGVIAITRKAVQVTPLKRGIYYRHAWTDSPASIKNRMIAKGYVLAGTRQP